MEKFELVFMDNTTQTVEAYDVQDAWVIGKIVAAQRKTYLLNIRPSAAQKRIGYRVGEPLETRAIDVIKFEVQELGNDHMITDVAKALKCAADLLSIEGELESRFGRDAIGMWLCENGEWAKKRYGPGDLFKIEIPMDAVIGSDLGEDGQFWIWKKQPVTSEFIQED